MFLTLDGVLEKRLAGLQLIEHTAARALDDEGPVMALAQFAVTGTAPYLR